MIPVFLIVGGSTGSGKSILGHEVIEYLEKNPSNLPNVKYSNIEYKKLLIDDIVTNTTLFKESVKEYFKSTGLDEQTFITKVNNLDKDLVEQLEKLYKDARSSGCDIPDDFLLNPDIRSLISKNVTGGKTSCDTVNDGLILKYLKEKKNILFETTLTSSPDWLWKTWPSNWGENPYREYFKEYYVVIGITILDFCTLIERNKTRAISKYKTYNSGKDKDPPRLPDVRPEKFIPLINSQKSVIIKLVKDFVLHLGEDAHGCYDKDGKNTNTCFKYIRILIYDNNNTSFEIVYDSDVLRLSTEEAVTSLIDGTYNIRDCNTPFGNLSLKKINNDIKYLLSK
jgi:hypothetical protein